MDEKLMTEIELAKRFGVTLRTAQGWRAKGIGPAFVVIGKNTIRYRPEDVATYEQKRMKTKQGE